MTSRNSKKENRVSEVPVAHRHEVKTLLGRSRTWAWVLHSPGSGGLELYWLVVWNMNGLFSMSYMGCHPSH